jgi:hypothetical protein
MKARLHPIWAGGKAGYVYSVITDNSPSSPEAGSVEAAA